MLMRRRLTKMKMNQRRRSGLMSRRWRGAKRLLARRPYLRVSVLSTTPSWGICLVLAEQFPAAVLQRNHFLVTALQRCAALWKTVSPLTLYDRVFRGCVTTNVVVRRLSS
jgi:hypothetical protein